MKYSQAELERIYSELFRCHLEARNGKRSTADEHIFEMNLFENLYNLALSVVTFQYQPSSGIAFITRKPVLREIFAAPYRDRIIHHYIFNNVIGYWEKHFVFDSYSCRKGKGTLFGIKRLESHIRKATENYTKEAYILKYDLSGYFMSLPRKKLYAEAIRGLDEQFPEKTKTYHYLKYLWGKIIFNDPTIGVRLHGNVRDWKDLPKNKSLFYQTKGTGIVIGNLTSQLLSNIYLNDFDHYMKEWLGYKFYSRYVDDFVVVVKKEQYKQALENEKYIRQFLAKKGLKLNEKKTYRQPVKKGVRFLGVVIYPYHTVAGPRVKNNFWQAGTNYRKGRGSKESLISYVGILKHHNCYRLTQKVLNEAGFSFREFGGENCGKIAGGSSSPE